MSKMSRRHKLIAVVMPLLVIALTGLTSPSSGAASCPTTGASGMLIGDVISCLFPEPESGPAAGVPEANEWEIFERFVGAQHSGLHGPEPTPPFMPAGCGTPMNGTWTQDHGVLNKVLQKDGRTILEITINFHWTSGIGQGGRSTYKTDVWADPGGEYLVSVGREMFDGTMAGRTGSVVAWNEAIIWPSGRYVGRAFAIGGTEGLANVRFEGRYTGFANKGGHWMQPSRFCFAD
jgi:hypothetical protein